MESKKYQKAKLATFTTYKDSEEKSKKKLNELRKIYQENGDKIQKSLQKAKEHAEWCDILKMYVVKNISDLNIRETYGFAYRQHLYLWPEEAHMLYQKGCITIGDESSDIKQSMDTDLYTFYGNMRRTGLFLTRDVKFKDLSQSIDQWLQDEDPEGQQTVKRQKVDGVQNVEEVKNGSIQQQSALAKTDSNDDQMVFQVYEDRKQYNLKQSPQYKIMLWRKDKVKLDVIQKYQDIKVCFVRNGSLVTLDFNFKVDDNIRDPRLLKRPRLNFGGQVTIQSQRPAQPQQTQSMQPPQPKPSSFSSDGFKMPLPPRQEAKEKPEERPKAVFWDEQGRLLDDKGNVVNLKQATELKINQKGVKDNKVKDLLKLKRFGQASTGELLAKRKFYDPTLDIKSNKRERRKTGAFNFVQEGSFIKRGEILRKKQAMEEYDKKEKEEVKDEPTMLDQRVTSISENNSVSKDVVMEESKGEKTLSIRKTLSLKPLDPIPDIEWWDAFFLPQQGKEGEEPPKKFKYPTIDENDIQMEKITHYIQHPIPIKNDYVENINKMIVPVHLTEKEKKKLRRMKRLEKEKDKQERVKLGLLPPPQQKIKLSNYMKVMGKEAIADPSRVEQKVRKIVEKRLEDHLKRNEDNKLTREQKEAKMKRKHERDLQNECRVAVFRVEDLTQPHLKFKVDMNAQQYHLGGFCFIADQTMASDLPHLVVVEGGPRAIKKYKRLMLRRINWNEKSKHRKTHNHEGQENGGDEEMKEPHQEQEENEDNMKASKDKKCFLVWEGIEKKKIFEKWRVVDIRSENEAKRLLGEKGCEHYWNMVITFQPERAEGEEAEQLEKLLL